MFRRKKSIHEQRKEHLILLAKQCQSAEELCQMAEDFVGCPIRIKASSDFPSGVPGMTIKNWDHFVIVYKPSSPLSIQFTILHELAHIVLKYLDRAKTLLYGVMKKPKSVVVEEEMEDLAYQLLVIQNGVGAFLPLGKNSEVAARYESLFR